MQDSSQESVLIMLFAKLPIAGKCKTRLGAEIGMDQAAALASAFLADSVERFSAAGQLWLLGDQPELAFKGEFKTLGITRSWRYWPQGEGHLGARQARSFAKMLPQAAKAGLSGVIAVGADTPHLPIELMAQASAVLSAGEVAVGPATDGGYYLLGLPCSEQVDLELLFSGFDWGGDSVLVHLTKRLDQQSLPFKRLPSFADIDHKADLADLAGTGGTAFPVATRSLKLLNDLGLS